MLVEGRVNLVISHPESFLSFFLSPFSFFLFPCPFLQSNLFTFLFLFLTFFLLFSYFLLPLEHARNNHAAVNNIYIHIYMYRFPETEANTVTRS